MQINKDSLKARTKDLSNKLAYLKYCKSLRPNIANHFDYGKLVPT